MTQSTAVRSFGKLGGAAAFGNAFAAGASLFVTLSLIGITALNDPQRLVELALHNPLPLLLQDALKFLSAATAFGLIFALWKRLRDSAPKAMHIATVFGLLAVGLLLANAALSLFAVSQAASRSQNMADGDTLNRVIGILGMGAIMVNGVWYLLVNWSARKSGSLPLGLCWLGLIVGAASLVPFLALGVLVLGIVWAVWLGIVLWNAQ
jgi:hypothetical protein